MTRPADEILDVAIVGGGVAGTYCAWRLAVDAPTNYTIALFEGSDRIGGRLLSLTPPGMPHLVAELGGMEFLDSHTLVRSLVQNKLNLPTRSATLSQPVLDLMPDNLAYLRGRRMRLKDLRNPDNLPYQLDWLEQGRDPMLLVGYALEQLLPGITSLSGAELETRLQSAYVEGRPLYQWGFWSLVRQAMSQEAYEFARDTGGFDFTVLNLNAISMIRKYLEMRLGTTFYHITTGYQQIPLRLCDEFEGAGGQVYRGHRLHSFDRVELPDGTEGVELWVYANSQGWGTEAPGEPRRIYARSLILALPRRALELLDQTGAVLGRTDVRQLIQSVIMVPMLKLFLCYPFPWWENSGFQGGRAVTDLPVRQCWYWGTEGEQPDADPSNRNSLLMAAFDDTLSLHYWTGFGNTHVLRPFQPDPYPVGDAPISLEWVERRRRTTQPMVLDAHRQALEIHGLRYAPTPYDAAYVDWAEDPFGGASNYWAHHLPAWEVAPRLLQPAPPLPVFICGECYAQTQGWVESALQTSEAVLQRYYGLEPPSWVTPN